jgi:hypothetical protein
MDVADSANGQHYYALPFGMSDETIKLLLSTDEEAFNKVQDRINAVLTTRGYKIYDILWGFNTIIVQKA